MKEEQELKRARSRKVNLERALEHETSGNNTAAYDCYQKAVDITPQIAFQLVKVLQEEQIAYIVAPYEADAEMAFLSIQGHVDVVITEDSDAIPFGCLKVLFKMDKFGQGVEFQYDDLAKNRDLNFTSFTRQMVLEMCILSGCDYLPSLPGMGLKRAHGLIRRFRNYHKVIKHLKYNGVSVPSSYEDMFTRAVLTFRHQWVYDPVLEDIVHLTPLASDIELSLDFLGPAISQKLGQAIARGEVDPITGVPFESKLNLVSSKATGSNGARKRQLDLPIQKNLLTNYFLSVSTQAKRQFKAPRNNNNNLFKNGLDRIPLKVKEEGFQSISMTEPSIDFLDLRTPANASAVRCRTSDFSFSTEDEDQVLNFLNSKMAHAASPDSVDLDIKASAGYGVTKSYFQKGKCVIQSVYFSKSKLAKQPLINLDTEPSTSEDTSFGERCPCLPSPDKCENRSLEGSLAENSQGAPEQHSQPRSDKAVNVSSCAGSHVKQCRKSVDHISVGEKKHVPMFCSKLLGESVQPGKFASDISHVEQYASIARKSMERFVSAIAPFRCSVSGARASGLRRPVKSILSEKANRFPGKMNKSAEDLKRFAYAPSNCRSSLGPGESVPGVKRAARLNDSLLPEWD